MPISQIGTNSINQAADTVLCGTSGNVGVGTSSPSTKLQVNGGYISQSDGTVTTYMGSDGTGSLFGTTTNQYLRFITNNTERMRVNAGAPILCLAGGNTSATGTGIAFPATQSASSDANTLDDYEEGTFTPTNLGGMTGFSAIDGTYTKVGRFVQVRGSFSITGVTTNMVMGGLPFASINQTFYSVVDQGVPVSLAYRRVDNGASQIQWNVNSTGSFSVTISFTAWYFTT